MLRGHPAELLHGDPLSPATRKARRSLLALSTVGIIVSQTGIFPSEISALGFTFAEADASTLLIICDVIIFYFLCAFLLYALPDIWVWRVTLKRQFENHLADLLLKPLTESLISEVVQEVAGTESEKPVEKKVRAAVEKLLNKVKTIASESSDQTFFPFVRKMPEWLRTGMHFLRIGFEFILPILLAVYSMYLVFFKAQAIMRL